MYSVFCICMLSAWTYFSCLMIVYCFMCVWIRHVIASNSQLAAPSGECSSLRQWGATVATWPPWVVWLQAPTLSTSTRSHLTSVTFRLERKSLYPTENALFSCLLSSSENTKTFYSLDDSYSHDSCQVLFEFHLIYFLYVSWLDFIGNTIYEGNSINIQDSNCS